MTNIAVKLAEAVRSFGIGSVYGDAVEIEGQTIVPVALTYFGFGGGGDDGQADGGRSDAVAGGSAPSESNMAGGGGGGLSVPIGAYVTGENGKVVFQPNLVSLLAVSIPVICVTGKALSRVIRALKK